MQLFNGKYEVRMKMENNNRIEKGKLTSLQIEKLNEILMISYRNKELTSLMTEDSDFKNFDNDMYVCISLFEDYVNELKENIEKIEGHWKILISKITT